MCSRSKRQTLSTITRIILRYYWSERLLAKHAIRQNEEFVVKMVTDLIMGLLAPKFEIKDWYFNWYVDFMANEDINENKEFVHVMIKQLINGLKRDSMNKNIDWFWMRPWFEQIFDFFFHELQIHRALSNIGYFFY